MARTNIQILSEREDLLRIFLSHVDAFTRNMQLEAKIREQENLALVGSVAGRIISDLKQPISTIKMASQIQSL